MSYWLSDYRSTRNHSMTTWVAVSFTVKSPDLLVNLIHFCCRHIALFTHIFGLLKPKSLLVIRILMVLIPILLVDNPCVIGYNYPNFATKTSPVLLAEMLIHQPFIRDIRYLIAFPFLRVKWLNIIHFVWETHTHTHFLPAGRPLFSYVCRFMSPHQLCSYPFINIHAFQ